MRLIDADALWMDIIRNMEYCDDILEIVEKQSTIEPERKRGEWIFVHPLQSDDSGAYMCSECKMGMWEIIPSVYHYCPNCGSEMEGEKNE